MYRSIRIFCPPGAALLHRRLYRRAIALVVLVLALLVVAVSPAYAQDAATPSALEIGAATTSLPSLWYLLAAGLAMLVPAGFVLLASANLAQEHAWNAALGGLAAAGLALFAYWAIGFAFQFGGVGLVYPHAGLRGQVWEWSPLSSEWGIGWGMAGLTGWFLSGDLSALSMSLFLGHAPWVMVAALLPVMTLRGRAPAIVTLLLALAMGGVIYPLAGNWVQGGGWLSALGRNLSLGHGFVDYGGAGSVHLVAAGFALAALAVWSSRRKEEGSEVVLPPAHQPLLAVVGALLILGGGIGWMFSNPLQVETVGEYGLMRGAVAFLLAASGGVVFPLMYTWFVTGRSEPTMSARGFAAGVVAGLACGPFVAPGIAFVIGLVAGATVPFVTYLLDGRLRIDDRSGVVISSGVPAIIGLLLVGIFADGRAGAGWQMTGADSYLGVTGQGVSGLLVASGYQLDFPAQLQSQVIGVVALGLWGFLAGLVVCIPLGLLFHSILHHNDRPARPVTVPVPAAAEGRPVSDLRQPTTTSTFAVPAPAYLDAPVRSATSQPLPPTTTPQGSSSSFGASPLAADSPAAPSASALPGYAPGERRAPAAATYVAPASSAPINSTPVTSSTATSTTGISEPRTSDAPVDDLHRTTADTPAEKPVPDSSWITSSAPADTSGITPPVVPGKREGYWPANAGLPAAADYRSSLPTHGAMGETTVTPPNQDAPLPGGQSLSKESSSAEPPPQSTGNGSPRNGNPLLRNGTRQRPAPLPDDTSPQSA